MASDPSQIGHAAKAVIRVDVEDVFDRNSGTKEISTDGMKNALRLSSRSRCLRMNEVIYRLQEY